MKLPEILLGVVDTWLSDLDQERAGMVLGLYLDLVWGEALCTAVAELLATGVFCTSPERETHAVQKFSQVYRTTFTRSSRRLPATVSELGSTLLDLRAEIEQSAKTRRPYDEILGYHAVGQIGVFGRLLGEALEPICRIDDSADPWHFRICMDEGETLSDFQLLVLNTMVRTTKTPVMFIVSFVSMPTEVHRTLFDHLTLQATDREIVSFERLLTDRRFRQFAEGVATVRLRDLAPEESFDVYRAFGTLDVNGLLHRILTESVSPFAKELERRAEALMTDPFFLGITKATPTETEEGSSNESYEEEDGYPQDDDSVEVTSQAPPIYQAFLIQELGIRLPPVDTPWKRRKQESSQLRKRMVAAYLAICQRLNRDPRYASAHMVLQLSDLCIRDFLRFVDHIFQHFGGDLKAFLAGQVSAAVQDEAIKQASITKSQGVDESGVTSPREVEMVVRGLGRITKILQTRGAQQQHLLSSERGVFVLPRHNLKPERLHGIYRHVREAAEAGFLRITELSKDEIKFRLHASLAPAYGLSYRGAYYPVQSDWRDMEQLSCAQTDAEVESIAIRVGRRLAGDEVLSLFPE
ncbi:MAG TPA: hypothetical protein VF632_25600 [Longimicrobium sp.]